jgi:predicted TPR repeat methyltransferase
MDATISILAEIPEDLHHTLRGYLETHPDWDQDRVFAAALSLFLMQNGECDRRAARVYLDTLFNRSVYR